MSSKYSHASGLSLVHVVVSEFSRFSKDAWVLCHWLHWLVEAVLVSGGELTLVVCADEV